VEANTLLNSGSAEPNCWWADVKTIRDNEFNLAAGRYKPQIAEPVQDEDPEELIRDILEIEDKITEELKKLLKEIEKEY